MHINETASRVRLAVAGLLLICYVSVAGAQQTATGTVDGRVLNATNGTYLTNARVTVNGTTIEDFTDSFGEYRLQHVPAGTVTITYFYTGLPTKSVTVAVNPGTGTTQDVALGAETAMKRQGETVRLDQYVVEGHRDTNDAAIAINEQRFAANIKNVMAADAFGDVTEGNPGDFLKFMPGVTVNYIGPNPDDIMIRGISSNYTSVTEDGNRIASAASSGTKRFFELEQISLSNYSRVEVFKSRTPDIAADALGGSVNLIPLSAFEHVRPVFRYRTYLSANTSNPYPLFKKTRGFDAGPSLKTRPGFDLTYIRPVTKNFGFTLSVLHSDIVYMNTQKLEDWAPMETSSVGATPENPYVRLIQSHESTKKVLRQSAGTTLDWRPRSTDVFSANLNWNRYDSPFAARRVNYDVGNAQPVAFGQTFVHGGVGKGSMSLGGEEHRDKFGFTYQADLKWRHMGPVWQVDGALSFSHASNHYHDYQNGWVYTDSVALRGLPATSTSNLHPTINFDDLDKTGYILPGKITAYDANGVNQINLADPANYNIESITPYNPADSTDVFRTARLNARRLFGFVAMKAGAQVTEQTRDIRKPAPGAFDFVGPDGKTNTADDNLSLYDLVDPLFSSGPYAGTPQIPWADTSRLYRLFVAHPEYFKVSSPTAVVTNGANNSQWLRETISAAYLMGDVRLLSNRLRIVTGVRFERTEDNAEGVLANPNAGKNVTDPLEKAREQFVDRGAHVKTSYSGAYPSFDASFNIRQNLIARFAYARSIGRPDLSNIMPHTTVPDLTSGSHTITVVNTALKPVQTNAYDVSLEYYFSKTGVISAGAFRKDFTDFVGSQPSVVATPDLLSLYNVPDPELYSDGSFEISSKANIGDARLTGVEFNYSQVLDTPWIPQWLHHFTVFANGQKLHLEGSTLADFSAFIPMSASTGIKYADRRFSFQVNVNFRGRQRMSPQSFEPGAFEYFKPRQLIDAEFTYRWKPHVWFFINGRNITAVAYDLQRYGPTTPSWARTYRRQDYGADYTAGIKGEF